MNMTKKTLNAQMNSLISSVIRNTVRQYDRAATWIEGFTDIEPMMRRYAVFLLQAGHTKEEIIEREIGVFELAEEFLRIGVDDYLNGHLSLMDDQMRFMIFMIALGVDARNLIDERDWPFEADKVIDDLFPSTALQVMKRLSGVQPMTFGHASA